MILHETSSFYYKRNFAEPEVTEVIMRSAACVCVAVIVMSVVFTFCAAANNNCQLCTVNNGAMVGGAGAGAMAAGASSVEWGICGPIDLVIILDNTGSMAGAIDSIKAEMPDIIATAYNASGGDLRLGYITFDDSVYVRSNLTTNISAVMHAINTTYASGGAGAPEASDEAKNTSINNLPEGMRPDATGYMGYQYGNFTTPYRPNATKIVVLITDAPPGGFNDTKDTEDVTAMHTHALTARSKGIQVCDVFVPTHGDYAGQLAILRDDAETTGGAFTVVAPDGSGTGAAIKEIITRCGRAEGPAAVPIMSPIGIFAVAAMLLTVSIISIVRNNGGSGGMLRKRKP